MAKKKDKKVKSAADDTAPEPGKTGPGFISQMAIAVALGAASFGTVYMLPNRAPAPVAEYAEAEHAPDPLEGVFPSKDELIYVKLDDIALTLASLDRMLKIGITLEAIDSEDLYIDPSDPVLRDAFTGYLRSLRTEQIEDVTFMVQLRKQLLRRAQLVIGTDAIQGVLITDFLVR
ncbi:MAG: flagellar basal body-associated FliL family protein [Acidimicrobiales bacterium]|nr:flagellar basal body-associated FliL family protein [Hyphomonadaceae bacterium]RZV42881.1 MAG: flagellar basal body-associated FliL family protein [Acidimicrobiales bacterium]